MGLQLISPGQLTGWNCQQGNKMCRGRSHRLQSLPPRPGKKGRTSAVWRTACRYQRPLPSSGRKTRRRHPSCAPSTSVAGVSDGGGTTHCLTASLGGREGDTAANCPCRSGTTLQADEHAASRDAQPRSPCPFFFSSLSRHSFSK